MSDPVSSSDLPAAGNVKVTRQDWLNVAMDILISDGVAEVKILSIGERLRVSRSSFYWYFKSRKDLLDKLLSHWERSNTGILLEHCSLPADSITGAVCNLFRCFLHPNEFNHRLDFAVREWARRDGSVRRVIDRSDEARHRGIAEMFERYGYSPYEAGIRSRVLYYMQIGYYALDLSEPLEERLSRVEGYLYAFTGVRPRPEEVSALLSFARTHAED